MARIFHALGGMFRESGQALDRLGCSLQGSLAHKEVLNRHRTVMNLFDKVPSLPRNGFVAPSASVIGNVQIGEKSSVWYGCVLRGDVNNIEIGSMTNIQDNSIIHVAKHNVDNKPFPTIIGNRVTVGHSATLHACTIEDDAFVGMGAIVMDGAVVKTGAMVGAGSLVAPGTTVPTGEIWAGVPAKFKRQMTAAETAFLPQSAEHYATLGEQHAEENGKDFATVEAEKQLYKANKEVNPDYLDHMGITREQYHAARAAHPSQNAL